MKKILLIFMAFMIFAYPVHTAMFPQQADAAVASKVASQAAKKIAKEVIVDEAINTAMNFALMEAIEIADNYQAKEGYKVVCPSGGSTCDKPIQVKTSLSDSDKSALRGQTEIELDKAITGGKGLTKWQKFLDWFVPVWITSFAATALTYAVDPNARSLFNEVGYNALVALGFITPVSTNEVTPPNEQQLNEEPELTGNESAVNENVISRMLTTTNRYLGIEHVGLNIPVKDTIMNAHYYNPASQHENITVHLGATGGNIIKITSLQNDYYSVELDTKGFGLSLQLTTALNGQVIDTFNSNNVNTRPVTESVNTALKANGFNIKQLQVQSIMTRMPYKVGDFYYTDVLINTVDGNQIWHQLRSSGFNLTELSTAYTGVTYSAGQQRTVQNTIHKNVSPYVKILPPMYEEIELEGDGISQKSQYEDDDGNIALVPPAAITYEEEATGEQVERKPNANGDGYVFEKPDGTIVPEEEVRVPPTWEPNITPSPTPIPNPGGNPDPYPEGTPTVTPSPTPSNPNPEPIPLTPSPTPQPEPNPETPPGTPPPPVETTEPYFPEGESCDVGLKIPKFLPLAYSISETFPFSIPFDLYGGFEALFIEMGSERPEFEFAFDFMGKEQSWTIAIPEYFDSWKPFTDSVLIFIFDVGIIYAIYRFMGGGS